METKNGETSIGLHGERKLRSVGKFLAEFNLSENSCNINYANFYSICLALFEEDEIERDQWRIQQIFSYFDVDKDEMLKEQEWKTFCGWLQATLMPINAIIVIDVQNDFIDGSLALRSCAYKQDGADVIAPINSLLNCGQFDKIIYSLDWHPEDHISFYENLHLRKVHQNSKVTKENAKPLDKVTFADPYVEQVLWPKHCVIGTWGAKLHKDLVIVPDAEQICKGQNPKMDAYSAFAGKKYDGSMGLQMLLQKSAVTDIYVCGLAYDVCVKATCLDGLQLGFALAVIDDCCRGVNASDTNIAKQLISDNGGLVTNSKHVLSMVNGGKRSLVMSHQRAKTMASISFNKEFENVSE